MKLILVFIIPVSKKKNIFTNKETINGRLGQMLEVSKENRTTKFAMTKSLQH
jgi:hypothetical protein